jgi:hypothetical protein
MGPQRKEGIYVGCESPSIIKYLDPPTGNLLQARFADCFFDEENFPCLVGQSNPSRDLNVNALSTPNMFPDPRTQECEREVERILHLNQLADRLPDSFNNAANVTKSHIHAANASARLERPALQTTPMKRGRGRDLQPRKRRTPREVHTPGEVCGGELPRKQRNPGEVCRGVLPCLELDDSEREAPVDSTEIAINFVKTGKIWDQI